MAIQSLPTAATVTAQDMVAIFSQSLGCDAKVSMSILAAYLETLLVSPTGSQTIYWAPNASGLSMTLNPIQPGANIFLLMTPQADYAAATIVFPALATLQDGQTIDVSTTHAVTTLTLSGNGAQINGPATAVAANGFFGYRFDGVAASWYRTN